MVFSCEFCEYKTNRIDNLNRHSEAHSKKKIQCGCGKLVSPSALWRHKKNSCKLKKESKPTENDQEPTETTANETIVKVQSFDVRVQTQDGKISYQHDPIIINGEQFLLIPTSSRFKVE